MVGTYITTKDDYIAIIKDKIRSGSAYDVSITKYVCKIVRHLNGDESNFGKCLVIYPHDIVTFFDSNEL